MSSGVLAITGANGFVGTHVASRAADAGYQVVGIGRESEPAQALAPHLADYVQADLSLAWPITRHLSAVVHLAGLSAVGPSFTDPQRYIEVNSRIMTRMCESLLGTTSRSRVIVVSSGSVYAPGSGEPIDECASTRPASPYAISKLLVETQASYYRGRGLDVLVARPFNHIGPGQGEGFLVPDLLASITNAPIGTPILIGNPDSARDFTDVRDVADAYLALVEAQSPQHSLYNVASGQAHSVREVLAVIAANLRRPIPEIIVDERRVRPNDPPRIVGNANRLRHEFGWAPLVPWEHSIRDTVRFGESD